MSLCSDGVDVNVGHCFGTIEYLEHEPCHFILWLNQGLSVENQMTMELTAQIFLGQPPLLLITSLFIEFFTSITRYSMQNILDNFIK